jgi:excisionase family DNA binding protein
MDDWLTVPETAKRLGVTDQTVQRWLRSKKLRGRLLARKIGWRVDPASIQLLLYPEVLDRETSDKSEVQA